jgi:hypothetical protein
MDTGRTLDLLLKLRMTYVKPEFAYGRRWRIPQEYSRKQLAERLRTLPCVFRDCREFFHRHETFVELDAAGCCRYELREHEASDAGETRPP